MIPQSGLAIREKYGRFDAMRRFGLVAKDVPEPAGCRCGEVITGRCTPAQCGLFGKKCTPIEPIGPCMVSSEGTCQAWFKYRREARRHEGTEARRGGRPQQAVAERSNGGAA
jgi:hydrogenase expression/formation protein HypD